MHSQQLSRASRMFQHIPRMRLVFDFDGTMTVKDTISELAQAAIQLQTVRHHKLLREKWDNAVEEYIRDYRSYNDNFKPPQNERHSLSDELKFLSGLRDIENASIDRVEASGVFASLQREDLFGMGKQKIKSGSISLVDGLEEAINQAEQRGWAIVIISVNWSRAFIEGVLYPHKIPIIANEVSEGGKIHGPEFLGYRLTTSSDKANCLRYVVAAEPTLTTVYFGDSPTDIECLLHQQGIIISAGPTSSLIQTLNRVGIHVPHVRNLQKGTKVCWARDFQEVLQSQLFSVDDAIYGA